LDPNANAGKPDPVNPAPKPHDIAEPGPINPATGQPDHGAEVSALKGWFRENRGGLIFTLIAVALVIIYLDPIDTLKVVIGLGLVIFIHELGHFVAAKWCDVHVRTFSIGFGPAVPFCSYKWGETTYMIGIIPLGGYVAMVGEGDNAGDDDAEEDPRSFRKKSVGQRMIIISAGVVMNIILGMACFVAAYMHGVKEKPATVASVESGSAAWRVGVRTGDDITWIGSRENPYFNDIRPIVMSTQKGETVVLRVRHADGSFGDFLVEPLKDEGARFPQLGVGPPYRLTLLSVKRKGFLPTIPGSPAADAKNPGFEPGDRIVGMTDPANPAKVTDLPRDPKDPSIGSDINEYYRRMELLAGKPVTFQVVRADESATVDIVVQPAYRADLGVRMQMGRVAALRVAAGPAEKAGPAATAGVVASTDEEPARGDKINIVKLPEPGGKQTWLTAGAVGEKQPNPNVEVRKLDPLLLPIELKRWADRATASGTGADLTVRLEVLRTVGHEENKPVELAVPYDVAYRHEREAITLPNSPLALGGLGLAYWVDAVVDDVAPDGPAADKLQRGDQITAIRFNTTDEDGKPKAGDWEELKYNQWASADAMFQSRPKVHMDAKVKRGESEVEVLDIAGRPDTRYPTDDRGLVFLFDFRTQKATNIGDAVQLGWHRTWRFVKEVYMNLYAMIFGRVSAKTMSGPLTIANVSYKFAGEDFWQFLLFLGMISVNLAVVNFLPIPVLDGGHMVFLILEKILGRPVPERVFAFAMYVGLFLILSLMVFVIVLDVRRLFFGLF
jgi:regulator of sigma E protease